jgi:hypothetical protein
LLTIFFAFLASCLGTAVLVWQARILNQHSEEFALQRQVASDIYPYIKCDELEFELVKDPSVPESPLTIKPVFRDESEKRELEGSPELVFREFMKAELLNLSPNPATNLQINWRVGGKVVAAGADTFKPQMLSYLLPYQSGSTEGSVKLLIPPRWAELIVTEVARKYEENGIRNRSMVYIDDLELLIEVMANDREGRRYRYEYLMLFRVEWLSATGTAASNYTVYLRVRPLANIVSRKQLPGWYLVSNADAP